MPFKLDLIPQETAKKNPLDIEFTANVECELIYNPRMVVIRELETMNLDYVSEFGIKISKDQFRVFIPWSNIMALKY